MRLLNNELRELALFSGVSRSELAQISRQLTRLSIPAGKVLVREGARGDEFMIVVDGRADVRQGGKVIATLGRGDLVGEMALLDDGGKRRRNATVTALTDLVIYVGSPLEFRQMISASPSVAERIHRTVEERTPAAA
jgi:CRP-like cAMP-binding protein